MLDYCFLRGPCILPYLSLGGFVQSSDMSQLTAAETAGVWPAFERDLLDVWVKFIPLLLVGIRGVLFLGNCGEVELVGPHLECEGSWSVSTCGIRGILSAVGHWFFWIHDGGVHRAGSALLHHLRPLDGYRPSPPECLPFFMGISPFVSRYHPCSLPFPEIWVYFLSFISLRILPSTKQCGGLSVLLSKLPRQGQGHEPVYELLELFISLLLTLVRAANASSAFSSSL